MRPPYLICERHCGRYEDCAQILQWFKGYLAATGRMHPIAWGLDANGCSCFQAVQKPDKGESCD